MAVADQLIIRRLGLQPYEPTWRRMQAFTDQRDADTPDEIWQLQHEPVFTQGQAGKEEHLLNPGDIPVVQVDRGGQVTYHGPGQAMVYLLIDLRRKKLGVRDLVSIMEQGVVDLLADYDIEAYAKPDAPGVYVNNAKIASLGLRVRRGCSFHGLALNLNMDLTPFLRINPCGYAGMAMTQLVELAPEFDSQQAQDALVDHLVAKIGYTAQTITTSLD
ncbi:lipoyl(octanoyl) transferase LipB [Marinobacterium arenosum]|uniref:lipoyl(octanoyl) transferase LipB n=1 Tax=Marinobacterium arenosum TaxID=2862496 RepID=UPI001C96C824|nr:lipoyl(octanoyl) transferase LipB [Marinobacterium arenosum]MBY4676214.1 lipoyl(octanoyl) transferase LipB [Marinobacterium arenosum]